MIAPLDPRTKKFYLEMGYSEKQIQQAFECSRSTGVDMLDALAMTQDSPPLPKVQPQKPSAVQPPKQLKAYVPPKSFNYRSSSTFLTPWNKLRPNDYQTFFSRSSKTTQTTKIELREEDYPVGLLNVSNCCYLNSLLQCYYLMNSFKVAILTSEPLPNLEEALASQSKTKVKRIKNEYDLLRQFKQFFTTMGLTSKRYLDPTSVLQNLVDSVGEKVSYGEEKDLSEINILIIERLSEGLEHSKNHYRPEEKEDLLDLNIPDTGSTIIHQESKRPYNSIFNPRQGAIKKMFYGTRVQYYDQPQLQKEPPIVSDFAGLILHPQGGNLTRALEEEFNFEVQLNGQLHKKTTFIRDEPQYLFLYINRTDFDRQQGQATKNQHKFTFDFTFYLDRYLERYRKDNDDSHEKIKELLATKNKLKEQINYLQILFKKVEECQKYAQELEGWSAKLPKEEEFQEEYQKLEKTLGEVEKELDQIQSRKEEYHLMYIFVHRGDAVSGHYWGYGRNAEQWYRFDINTSTVEQDQIVIDLEKSSATPYALLYVKSSNLPNFDYKLHLNTDILKEKYPETDFRGCFDPKVATEIVHQNQKLRQEVVVRNEQALKSKTYNDYLNRFSGVKKLVIRNEEQNRKYQQLLRIRVVNNFSLFLWTHQEIELAKFTMFEQALLSASSNKINISTLMHQKEILQMIQKKFKKNCHGDLCLKFYSLLPKEVQKLTSLYQEYQFHAFQVIWGSVVLNGSELFYDEWTADKTKANGSAILPSETVKRYALRLLKLLRIRKSFLESPRIQEAKKQMSQVLYISQINNEISKILMLAIASTGLKIESLKQFVDVSDQVGIQIGTINAANGFTLETKEIGEEKKDPLEEVQEFVTSFHSMSHKKNQRVSTSSATIKIPQEKRETVKSGFKNSFLASPSKVGKTKISQSGEKERKVDELLVTSQKEVVLLDGREQWKTEQLDTLKINYEFGPRLINFLKKMDPIPKIYKKVSKLEKPLSLAELKEEGLVVNQEQEAVMEESLI